MEIKELKTILEIHLRWINDEKDGRRADLSGANLDFSCFPLWCGAFGVKVGDKFIFQLLFHLLKLNYIGDNPLIKKLFKMKSLIKLANQTHLIRDYNIGLIEFDD
jgi:hypothetical protein